MPTPNQIILAFSASVAGSSYSPAMAATAMAAVKLYANDTTDPVLGQLLGLTVASDTTTTTGSGATRTITLNMTGQVGAPTAPPIFPCNPITSKVPFPPYPLLRAETLAGSFLTVPGSGTVVTSDSQIPALVDGATIQFASQPGVFYTLTANPLSGSIAITPNYSGPATADEGAAQMVPAPAKIVAIYSSSPLDTNTVGTTPPIPAGPGVLAVQLTYKDSTGAGPFTVSVSLMGTYPSPVTLHAGSVDVAEVINIVATTTIGFGNSVGQITLCELSEVPPPVLATTTPQQFQGLTDRAQMLITRGLAYLPPSYFALAQPQASFPQLEGDFTLTQGSAWVPTSEDQTSVVSGSDTIQFAVEMAVDTPFGAQAMIYTVDSVTPKGITLSSPWAGLNENPIDSGAFLVGDSSNAAPPTDAQLASLAGEFVNPGTAIPPPNPPLEPATMSPAPTILSGLFAKAIQLALAVPVVQSPIVFA
jgi:hypothetical protein